MPKPAPEPHALKEVPFAVARPDGGAIKFAFLTHKNKTFEFECPPEAAPMIILRLLAAAEQAAMNAGGKPRYRALPVRIVKSEISDLKDEPGIALTLYPTLHQGISFALDPGHARRLSGSLAKIVATFPPTDTPPQPAAS